MVGFFSLQLHPLVESVQNSEDMEAETSAEMEGVSQDEAVERLKDLKELFDLGIISETEFEEKKKEYMKYL